jgi:hypothetical protein
MPRMFNREVRIATAVLAYTALLLFICGVGPFFTIWSINTLFHLGIECTFKTWIAVNWLIMMLHTVRFVVKPDPPQQQQQPTNE